MSENLEHHDDGHEGGGHHINYKKIYFTLVGLLIISVAGPFAGIVIVTLITAFGIAVVKANLVIQNFMHLKAERRLMKWMLATSLILMALMMAGISSDVLNHEGRNWENLAAKAAIERGIAGPEEAGALGAGEAEREVAELAFRAEATFGTVCASCHGQAGDGTGPAGAALDPPPANFTDPEFWATRDRDRIVNVITNGAAAAFGGSPLMVAWSASYTPEQIQELADYVMEFRPE
jgi:caa(3)-type oxidase subunit IV